VQDLRRVLKPRPGVWAIAAVALLAGAGGGNGDRVASNTPTSSTSSPATSSSNPDAGSPLPQPVQQLEINATEYSFKISPDPSGGLQPGWTLVKFHNVGVEPHQVMFARIKDGVDMSKLAAAGANDSSGASAIKFVDMIGGVSYIGPGHDTTALVKLTQGTVMAMCYVPDAKGVAHALMGMTAALTVSPPSAEKVANESPRSGEQVLGTIELSKDGYQLPSNLGVGWYHVENTDSALHEMALLRLGESIDHDQVGALVDDLAANRTPPVPLEAVGGMGAISPGFDGYLHLDLTKGDYLAVDFMPDPGAPRPHMLDGYHGEFSI
jgi:hypothetical protein